MAKKRAAGGGRKEVDHQIRLAEMARIILANRCSPQKAARQVAARVVGLGDDYDWQGQPRIRNIDSLSRRLAVQWARRGRGDAILAAERALREGRRGSSVPWPHADAILSAHAQGRSVSSLFPPIHRGLSAEQTALAKLGLDRRQMLIPTTSVSSLYPEIKAAVHPVRAISETYHPDDTPEETALERVVRDLERKRVSE